MKLEDVDLDEFDLDALDWDDDKEKSPEERKREKRQDLFYTIIQLVIILVICFLIISFVGQRIVVSGHSMEPFLQHKDNLIVDKISYRFNEPERYDIVIFHPPSMKAYYVKRIIGLPGETVQIKRGQVYINGERLESDTYGKELMMVAGRAGKPITLKKGEYFVLGDNRNDSDDSRFDKVGNVTKKQLGGKAFVRIWPLNKIGMIRHQ